MTDRVPSPPVAATRWPGLVASLGGVDAIKAAMQPSQDGGERWLNGFTFPPNMCDYDANVQQPIACGNTYNFATVVDSSDESLRAEQNVQPFMYFAAARCSTIGSSPDEVSNRALTKLAWVFSAQLEKELWNGAASRLGALGNQHLNDVNASVLNNGTQLGFVRALAELQQAWGTCGDGMSGMIHATVRTASMWFAAGAIIQDPETGYLYDAMGNQVVAGAGYGGESPSFAADATGQSAWAFVTAPVVVRITNAAIVASDVQRLDVANNVDRAVAGRAAVAYYDPCCKYGVKVDHTKTGYTYS